MTVNLQELRQWMGIFTTPLTLGLIAWFVTWRLAKQERVTTNERNRHRKIRKIQIVNVMFIFSNVTY